MDAILCDENQLALMTSGGFESLVLKKRYILVASGETSISSNIYAFASELSKTNGFNVALSSDGTIEYLDNLLILQMAKHPFYGYGLNVNSGASLESGVIHARLLKTNFKIINSIYAVLNLLAKRTKSGNYFESLNKFIVDSTSLIPWQMDGEPQ